VVGVDVNPLKVEMINAGQSPIIEQHMERLVAEAVAEGRLRATTSPSEAVEAADVSMICVGTPSQRNGDLDLQYVENVSRDIGERLVDQENRHIVALRSTVLPGTVESCVIPTIAAASNGQPGVDFSVCSNPEFLREGSAVRDFDDPPFTLIGESDQEAGARLASLYESVNAPVVRTDVKTAEMIKYVSNAFHALKITFANEIGNLCKQIDIDSHRVMDIVCMDTRLNISSAYLKPGYAFGGSCLPKDLRALLYKAKQQDVDLHMLGAIPRSNEKQIKRALSIVTQTGKRKVGLVGLSFKPGTDDLRESPLVLLAESLLGKGYQIKIYDENVFLARMVGANREYIERTIPHISSLMCENLEEVIEDSEVLVVGHRLPALSERLDQLTEDHIVIDLARLRGELDGLGRNYQGICW
jgi:GDP-mannose 6-dehydrogenase